MRIGPSVLAAPVALLLAAASASPATVIAPTFEQLVAQADSIVVTRVAAMQSTWMTTREGRAIVTDVTFSIDQTLKGPVHAERTLEFLGGTVGDDTLRVADLPEFHVGDRDVLFVNEAGRPVSPIVGFMYGRFRIVGDPRTGLDQVRTFDGRPLASTAEVGNAQPPAVVAPLRTLSLEDFVAAIRGRVAVERR